MFSLLYRYRGKKGPHIMPTEPEWGFQRLIGNIEGKLDAILASLNDHKTRTDSLEVRVKGLETWRDKQLGMAVIGGVIVACLAAILSRIDLGKAVGLFH